MVRRQGVREQGFTAHGRGFFIAFVVELALYVLIGAGCIAAGADQVHVVYGVVAVFFTLRLLLVLGNFVPSWRARSPKRAEHEIGAAATLAMFIREWWAAVLTYPFLFAFEPWLAPNNPPPGRAHRGLPVVLVPGFFTNRGYLSAWRAHLLRSGYGKVYTLSPEPVFESVERNAEHLARFVDEVLADTGAGQVILIGHSMGGLTIRLYLHRFGGMDKAGLAIAVGSPFGGTVVTAGKERLGPILGQLSHGSEWARTFRAEAEAAPCPVPFIAVWSPHDSIVSPQDGARVAEHYGRNIVVPGIAHMEMVNSRTIMCILRQELDAFNGDGHRAPAG